MDPRLRGYCGSINGIPIEDQPVSFLLDRDQVEGPSFASTFASNTYGEAPTVREDSSLINTVPSSTVTSEEDPHEDCDFSDAVLSYINQILMEEDMDDKTSMLQESLNLQAAEKSFYDVIGQKYPPSPEQIPSFYNQNAETQNVYMGCNHSNCTSCSSSCNVCLVDPNWISTPEGNRLTICNDSDFNVTPMSSWNNMSNNRYLYGKSELVWQFEKGANEASKFLPSSNGMLINFTVNGAQQNHEPIGDERELEVKVERRKEYSPSGSRWRKCNHRDDEDYENERISKQAAVFPEPTLRSEMFDTVLLCSMGKGEAALQAYRELLRNGTNKKLLQKAQSKGQTSSKGRVNKQNRKKEVVDLRTLLMTCAQAIAADDHQTSNELLKQIRQHSSPFGDGNQRLAHYFAGGIEARLAGTGSSIYKAFVSKRTIASDYLKAYHLYLASCPFRKISHFVSNRTIMDKAENSSRVHIIDFGILYGFQWPTFFQRIATREGGPPRVRITGIEFPQPGFRPALGVEETGRRLADYARIFNVPFEYNAIAKNWDSIQLEELKIEKDEYLAVTSLYRVKNLHDETVLKDSSRIIVLNLIRKINPNLFILGILNGSYGAPFFVTRFREALFHFSSLFDMLETNVPREHHERMLIEREIFGKEALNVIACEGWERIERPETYKQWQVRNLRAGLTQIPLSRQVMATAIKKVRTSYHKDFLIDEDSQWLIQGWKGRITYALSCWKSD